MKIQEILTAIGEDPMYNLHAHTQFCDGRADMADFAAEASRLGFKYYGFTPHSPISVESTCNMSKSDIPAFLAEVDRLNGMYPAVYFLKGMEIDYIDDNCGPACEYFHTLGLDYAIGSVHFIPTQEGDFVDIDGRPERFISRLNDDFHGDLEYVVKTFFDQSMKMVSAGGFDIIGHFDKIKHNASCVKPDIESESWYKNLVGDLIDSIIASGVVVEINTKALEPHGQLFPAQYHWRHLLDAGVPIVVNSDAHYVERINAGRMQVIKALGYLRDHPRIYAR